MLTLALSSPESSPSKKDHQGRGNDISQGFGLVGADAPTYPVLRFAKKGVGFKRVYPRQASCGGWEKEKQPRRIGAAFVLKQEFQL